MIHKPIFHCDAKTLASSHWLRPSTRNFVYFGVDFIHVGSLFFSGIWAVEYDINQRVIILEEDLGR